MRNIHILPTNKPSRLIYNDANQLIYQSNNSFKNDRKWMYRKAFNIYITNSEEIKEGDWGYRDSGIVFKMTQELLVYYESIKDNDTHKRYKIILTTDQDLIKHGVQSIDDEFLEWFVKNPSIELIKTDRYQTIYNTWLYKIIIPKQETIEEAAEKYAVNKSSADVFRKAHREDYINGAKWQQEQDNKVIQDLKDRLDTVRHINTTVIKAVEKLKEQYDIDVINAFNEGQALNVRGNLIQGKEWFEKFKKK